MCTLLAERGANTNAASQVSEAVAHSMKFLPKISHLAQERERKEGERDRAKE